MPVLPKLAVQQLKPWPAANCNRGAKIRMDAGEHPEGFARFLPFPISPPELVYTYPDYHRALDRLATTYGVKPENITLTNGSDNALGLIANTFIEPDRDRAICNTPTFPVIPHGLQMAGAITHMVALCADFSADIDAINAALSTPTKLAMFASPDNPSGMLIPAEAVKTWCAAHPTTLFVIDEAYFEYTGQTVLPLATTVDNLLVTRTFSKAWGLAGLRAGMVIGNAQLVECLNKARPIYDVNAMAIVAIESLLDHSEQIMSGAHEIMRRKSEIITALERMGHEVHAGHANFFLLNMREHAHRFAQHCAEHNILVRVCAPNAQPGEILYGQLRLSVPDEQGARRFLAAVSAFR